MADPDRPVRTSEAPAGPPLDFRGARRLTGAEEWAWYLAAAVSYIVLGIWHKWLLNWFVGPLWLVTIIVVGPALLDRLRAVRRTPTDTVRTSGDAPQDDR